MAIVSDPCSSAPVVASAASAHARSVKARLVMLEVVVLEVAVQMLPANMGEQIVLIALLPASRFVPDWCLRTLGLIAGAFAGRPLLQRTAAERMRSI